MTDIITKGGLSYYEDANGMDDSVLTTVTICEMDFPKLN